MRFSRDYYLSTRRDAWVEINLDNLEHNVRLTRQVVPSNSKLFAVVKADAYGHGAVMCAPSLLASGVDFLGVASIDEGVQLREAKIKAPILVLGAVPVWSIDEAAQNDITISIFSDSHIKACRVAYEKNGHITKAHIKIDTGMNRIGICPDKAIDFIKKVQQEKSIELTGIFTHFACAENIEETEKQLTKFNSVIQQIDTTNLLIHTNNSAGILNNLNNKTNMSRAGIILYGLLPDLAFKSNLSEQFKQVLSLKARITNIHTVDEDCGVSYSHTYKTKRTTKIATVPIGYADGVSRALSNKMRASINNHEIRQIGNITMDQMMFDITGIDAKEGDIITLLGNDGTNYLSIDEWAKILNTINYELTCRLKVRLARVYTRN